MDPAHKIGEGGTDRLKAGAALMDTAQQLLPGAVALLVPLRDGRLAAAALQVLLQVVILITGNYTYFNFN